MEAPEPKVRVPASAGTHGTTVDRSPAKAGVRAGQHHAIRTPAFAGEQLKDIYAE